MFDVRKSSHFLSNANCIFQLNTHFCWNQVKTQVVSVKLFFLTIKHNNLCRGKNTAKDYQSMRFCSIASRALYFDTYAGWLCKSHFVQLSNWGIIFHVLVVLNRPLKWMWSPKAARFADTWKPMKKYLYLYLQTGAPTPNWHDEFPF